MLDVVLAPHAEGGAVDRIDVRMRIGHPELAAGQTLLRMPLTSVGIPTAGYDVARGARVARRRCPPCHDKQAEYKGKCYLPVSARSRDTREPRSWRR